MLEITQEDRENIRDLIDAVQHEIGDDSVSPDALAPLVWNELRAAHSANKSLRIQQEMQNKAKELGNAGMPMGSAGYYGQKL